MFLIIGLVAACVLPVNSLKVSSKGFEKSYNYPYSRLFVPTQIKKINNYYFIVDSNHHRIIFSDNLDSSIEDWTPIDYEFAGPHSISSNGEIYVVDNTGRNEVLVFDSKFKKIQTISNVGLRPHKVLFDRGKFYVLSSQTQEIYCYSTKKDMLVEEYHRKLPFLEDSYVRSIKIIGNNMYFIANNNTVFITNYLSTNYEVINKYKMPSEFVEMVDVELFNGNYFVSAMGTPESGIRSQLVKGSSLRNIENGIYTDVYTESNMVGKPYLFEEIDNKLFFTEIGEVSNGVLSVDKNNMYSVHYRFNNILPESWERRAMYPL